MLPSAQTVDELAFMASQDPNLYFAYFYCTIGDLASQSARNLLGSLVAQLSGKVPSILDDIRCIYNRVPKSQAHRFPIDTTILESAIVKSASERTQVILLIDAINESHDMELIERSLWSLSKLSSNIRILVTTINSINSIMHPYASVLRIDAEMREDIHTFILYRLRTDDTLKNLPPKFQAQIETSLLSKADGSLVGYLAGFYFM